MIQIENINEVYAKVNCPEDVAMELREVFTFDIPGAKFNPKVRARRWDGKIRLFNPQTKRIYRGLVPEIIKYCVENNYHGTYKNKTTKFNDDEVDRFIESLNMPVKPRDYQIDFFKKGIRDTRGIMVSPTGSGKSMIIYLWMRYLFSKGMKGLIIVPNTSLVEQLYADFLEYGFTDVDKTCDRMYSGSTIHGLPILITTWQSIFDMPKEFFKDFDFVIGDEAHQYKAKSLMGIMEALTNAKYRFGTTGTLDGTKVHKLVLEGLFGPVSEAVSTFDLQKQSILSPIEVRCIILKHKEEIRKQLKGCDYQTEIKYLTECKERTNTIAVMAGGTTGNTLVLFNFIQHGTDIISALMQMGLKSKNLFFVSGATSVQEREDIRKYCEHHNDAIVVASYGTFSTGINIKNLHNIIFASPSKSRIRVMQSIGRGLRTAHNKTSMKLFDIADDLSYSKKLNYTLRHFMLRLEMYAIERFPFKKYEVTL